MDEPEIKSLIEKGDTSTVQFKLNVTNELSIAQEMVAKRWYYCYWVDDKTWAIEGLADDDIRRLPNLLVNAANEHVNAANEHVKPPVFIETETFN